MYDNEPSSYSDKLSNEEKCRYTINALMRMRFCKSNGELEFNHKLNIDQTPVGFKAWFLHTNRILKDNDIFFGHWSTLKNLNIEHIFPMDHGCVWGEKLSAFRFTDRTLISQEYIEGN